MVVTVGVAILVLLLLVAYLLIRRSRDAGTSRKPTRSEQELAPIEVGEDLPTFNVIALGGQETGKTVLLASMFHRLSTELREGGFRLQTSLDQSVHLTNLYAELSDPDAAWPPGTTVGETRSFTFECIGSAGGAEFPVLRFNYLDYAGELVGGGPVSVAALDQREQAQRDLERRIKDAHALFGIIDGHRMLKCLQGDPEGRLYLDNSIVPMIGVMREAKCPLHLILTKWDLFDGVQGPDGSTEENDRLDIVRNELISQRPIRNLVQQRRRDKRAVRLIPVSAIGRQFAVMDAEEHMVKRKNGRLRPVNVEVPLCAVLPDLFAQIQEQLDESEEAKLAAERRVRARLTPQESVAAVGKFLARPAGVALRAAIDIAIGRNAFSDRLADTFIDWVGKPFDEKMRRVGAVVDDATLRLNEMRLARNAVMKEFSERIIVLKHQLPASDLADAGLQ